MPQPHGGAIGKPAYDPEPNRRIVRVMAEVCGQELIAQALHISVDTLQRHHIEEFREGKRFAVHAVGAKLLERALKGCTAEAIFFLKTHGGEEWSQTQKHELGGPGGGPIVVRDFSAHFKGKSLDQLRALDEAVSILIAAGGIAGLESADSVPAAAESGAEQP